jgi:hypothetical protein
MWLFFVSIVAAAMECAAGPVYISTSPQRTPAVRADVVFPITRANPSARILHEAVRGDAVIEAQSGIRSHSPMY